MDNKFEPTCESDFTFACETPFRLTGGGTIRPVTLRYAVYGSLQPECQNVILVCHALSGSARVADWWGELFGPGRPFDLAHFVVIGINAIGSCYGSTGPTSVHPDKVKPYGGDFPVVSILDMVRAQAYLLDYLGISHLHAVVGGSIGGMQSLCWASEFPGRLSRCIAIGAAPLSAMALACSHLQRQAIRSDPAWCGGHYSPSDPPRAGLALARAIAICSYKSAVLFERRHGRTPDRSGEDPARSHDGRFDVGGYLDHQGKRFEDRFDANSYLVLTRAMETFDVSLLDLQRIKTRVLLIGIASDQLFPATDVRSLAVRMQRAGVDAQYTELTVEHGHDAFLADWEQLAPLIARTLYDESGS